MAFLDTQHPQPVKKSPTLYESKRSFHNWWKPATGPHPTALEYILILFSIKNSLIADSLLDDLFTDSPCYTFFGRQSNSSPAPN
jgi:hypothetical protein